MNVAFIAGDGVLKHATRRSLARSRPPPEGKLLRGVEVGDVPLAEARGAREMLLIGRSIDSPAHSAMPHRRARNSWSQEISIQFTRFSALSSTRRSTISFREP